MGLAIALSLIFGCVMAIMFATIDAVGVLKEIRDELRDNRHGRS